MSLSKLEIELFLVIFVLYCFVVKKNITTKCTKDFAMIHKEKKGDFFIETSKV